MIASAFGLENHGLRPSRTTHWNLSAAALVEAAVARQEGRLSASGALVCLTGERTGRSPRDKFVVRDSKTENAVDWGKTNQPLDPDSFEKLYRRSVNCLNNSELFVVDAWAGADPRYSLPIRVVTTKAWHALFARQLFRRPPPESLAAHKPEFVVLGTPDCKSDPKADGVNSEAYIVVDFGRRMVLVGGTSYAGEIKKSVFTVLNYLLPERGVFPMHCSANVGETGDSALFFGLSGTGKTTLSADPRRRLIGDDEHGWSDHGVFNFEGGCYAKCIRLSEQTEPQIYRALRFGAVLENVVLDEHTRMPDYDSAAFTENTRAAYPVEYIDNAIPEGMADAHPAAVVFLTCDAFGVLPPISLLSTDQAMYHFLSGYTAKVAGTEAGMGNEPQATFSTCFGAPFLPRDPMLYARLLAQRIGRHGSKVYLVNTGWTGGPFGVGRRIDLSATRAMISAALSGAIADGAAAPDPVFGLRVPPHVPGVRPELLTPRACWPDPTKYDAKLRELAGLFVQNFEKFGSAAAEVKAAGPRV